LGCFPGAQFRSFDLEEDALTEAISADSDGSAFLERAGLATKEEQAGTAPPVAWSVFVVLVAGVAGRSTDLMLKRLQAKYPDSAILGGVCQGAFVRRPGGVHYSEGCVVGLAMAGNVPLQALVTRGAKPLTARALEVTKKVSNVRDGSGNQYLLLQSAREVDEDEEDDEEEGEEGVKKKKGGKAAEAAGGAEDSSSGSSSSSIRSSGTGFSSAGGVGVGVGGSGGGSSLGPEKSLMSCVTEALERSASSQSQMYYLGVKHSDRKPNTVKALSTAVGQEDGATAAGHASGRGSTTVDELTTSVTAAAAPMTATMAKTLTTMTATGYTLLPLSNSMFQQGGIVIPAREKTQPKPPPPPPTSSDETAGDEKAGEEEGNSSVEGSEDSEGSEEVVRVRFYQLDEAHCKLDAGVQLRRAKAQLDGAGRKLMGALLFSCGGRGPHQFGGTPMMDATAFSEVFPNLPMTGFYAGGEVGPQALAHGTGQVATQTGNATLQGFTCVFGLFSVPERDKLRAGFASTLPSTLDSTSEGLQKFLATRTPRLNRLAAATGTAAGTRTATAGTTAAAAAARVPSDAEIDEDLSVKSLKELIVRAKLSFVDCVEKPDLRARAKTAAAALRSS